MRSIIPMDHLEEAVNRAAEMGKSIFLTQGTGVITTSKANALLAGISITGKVAEHAAKLGVPIKVICREPILQNINETVIREAFTKVGKPEAYDPSIVVFASNDNFGWANFCANWILKEKPASCFLVGDFGGSSLYLAESAARAESLSIAGNYYVFGVCSDYYLVGEELFAAGAYASDDPEQKVTIAAQDLSKFLLLALMIAAMVANLLGTPIISQILKW